MNALDRLHVAGPFSCESMVVPNGAVRNASIATGDPLDADKLEERYYFRVKQEAGTDVVTRTEDIHVMRAAGTLVDWKTSLTDQLATTSRSVSIVVNRSTGGGAFAAISTAAITWDATDVTLRTVKSGTFSSSALIAGDILQVVVTASGGAGNWPRGLMVEVHLREKPA